MVTGRRMAGAKVMGTQEAVMSPMWLEPNQLKGEEVAESESQGMLGYAGRGDGRKQRLFHDNWLLIWRRKKAEECYNVPFKHV